MNPKKPHGSKVVSAGIGLPPSLNKRLAAAAKKSDLSKSKLAASIIREALDNMDKAKHFPKDKDEAGHARRFILDGHGVGRNR